MNRISEKQSEDRFLKLYAATSQVYDEGKRTNTLLFVITFLSALILPIVALHFDYLNEFLNMTVGILGAAAALYFSSLPDKKKETGAKLQEQFDTQLFDLAWNNDLVGSPLDSNFISQKALEYGPQNIEKLKGKFPDNKWKWYSNFDKLPHKTAVLSCQEENLYWDKRQKGEYARFLGWCTFLVLLFGIVLYKFSAENKDVVDYLKKVLVIQLPLIIHLISMYSKNRNNSIKLGSDMERAQDLRQEYVQKSNGTGANSNDQIPDKVLRSIQNAIYRNRSTGMLVPTWFYKIKTKRKYQKVLDETAKEVNK